MQALEEEAHLAQGLIRLGEAERQERAVAPVKCHRPHSGIGQWPFASAERELQADLVVLAVHSRQRCERQLDHWRPRRRTGQVPAARPGPYHNASTLRCEGKPHG